MALPGQDPSRTPVIVGVGQVTDTTSSPADARSPLGLMLDAARLAGGDSGAGAALLRGLDSIAVVRLFADSSPRFKSPFGSMVNPPWSLSGLLDARPADMVYAPPGGDSPQVLLTRADFHDLGMAYFRRLAADGGRHAEIFFDPQTHTDRGLPFAVAIDGLLSAMDTKVATSLWAPPIASVYIWARCPAPMRP